MKLLDNINFDNMVIASLTLIICLAFIGMGFSEYMDYLSGKQTRDLIREAISKNMSEETIKTLIK
jgi:hypothetical protein